MNHVCEKKRRWLQRDEAGPRLGFQAFCRFWEIHHRAARPRTQEDFQSSSYYLAFVRWGRYCVDLRAVNPSAFIDHLIRTEVPIDRWTSDQVYTDYLLEYLGVESVTDALTRAVEYSVDWERDTDMRSCDILRYGNTNTLIHAVSAGRLSPWVIYCSGSGQQWLNNLRSDQVKIIWPYINADRWNKILLDRTEDRVYTSDILERAGW